MNGPIQIPAPACLPACRRCGCTELDVYWAPPGEAARPWAAADLCGGCAPVERAERGLRRWRRRFFILLGLVATFYAACLVDALVEVNSPPAFGPAGSASPTFPNAPVDSGSTGFASPASRRS